MTILAVRRQMLAKVHIAKKQLALDDDTYRDTLRLVTGKASAADCSDAELGRVVEHFSNKGFHVKPLLSGNRHTRKIRALWISAYNLGLLRDSSDEAMEKFVKRQTGIDSSRWIINAADAAKVVEALKQWLAREGKVDWSPAPAGMATYCNWPGYKIAVAQWLMLTELGNVKAGKTWTGNDQHPTERLFAYGSKVLGAKNLGEWTHDDWIKISRALGKRVRAVLAKKREASPCAAEQ